MEKMRTAPKPQSQLFGSVPARSQEVVELLRSIKLKAMQTEELPSNYQAQYAFKIGSVLPSRENLMMTAISDLKPRPKTPLWSNLRARQSYELLMHDEYLEWFSRRSKSMEAIAQLKKSQRKPRKMPPARVSATPSPSFAQIEKNSTSECDLNLKPTKTANFDQECAQLEESKENAGSMDKTSPQAKEPGKSEGENHTIVDGSSDLRAKTAPELPNKLDKDEEMMSNLPEAKANRSLSCSTFEMVKSRSMRSPHTIVDPNDQPKSAETTSLNVNATSNNSKDKFLAFAKSVSKEMLLNSKLADGSAAISKNIREAVALINEVNREEKSLAQSPHDDDKILKDEIKSNNKRKGNETKTPQQKPLVQHQGLGDQQRNDSGDIFDHSFEQDVEVFLNSLSTNKCFYSTNRKAKYAKSVDYKMK